MTSKENKSILSVLLYLTFILSPLLMASATATEGEQTYSKYVDDWETFLNNWEEFGLSLIHI